MKTSITLIIIGFFGLFSKQSNDPYKDEAINQIYELLFCDNLEKYQNANDDKTQHPWNLLFSESTDKQLTELLSSTETESRVKILAHHKLKNSLTKKDLLGVIIEVSLPQGLDVLAAYSDGTARYINHTGKLIVWETKTKESTQLIKSLFKSSENVVSQIGPWEGSRLSYPEKGNARLSFLVSNQLYFGEGSLDVLSADPMGSAVLNDGTKLMEYLINNVLNEK